MKIWLCVISLFYWVNVACAQAPAEHPDVPLSDTAYADMNSVNPAALEQCYTGPRAMTRYEFAVAVARSLQQIPVILKKNPAAAPALARLITRFTPELQQLGFSQTQLEFTQKELAAERVSTPAKDSIVPFGNSAYADFKTLLDADDVTARCFPIARPQAMTRYEFAVATARILQNIDNAGGRSILQTNPAAVAAVTRLITQFTPEIRQLGISQTQIEDAQIELASYRISTPAPVAPFPDVPKNHWAFDAVERLRQSGIVVGYPAGSFSK